MKLRELFAADAVKLELEASTKDDLLKELVALLRLDPKSEAILFKTLKAPRPIRKRIIARTSLPMASPPIAHAAKTHRILRTSF